MIERPKLLTQIRRALTYHENPPLVGGCSWMVRKEDPNRLPKHLILCELSEGTELCTLNCTHSYSLRAPRYSFPLCRKSRNVQMDMSEQLWICLDSTFGT